MEVVRSSWKDNSMQDTTILSCIDHELSIFEFKRNSISYEYLVSAIYIVSKDKLAIRNFKINVYAKVAQIYGTKVQNVQWSLDKFIYFLNLSNNENTINEYFQIYTDENISTKEFIMGVSKKVRMKLIYSRKIENVHYAAL